MLILRAISRSAVWPCVPISSVISKAIGSQARRSIAVSASRKKASSASDSHRDGDAHSDPGTDSGHGHKHDSHEHWYEFPPHIEVYRHSRLKIPWYIGGVPSASYRAPCHNDNRWTRFSAIFLTTMMWWWIAWNWMMDPGHVSGEYLWPNRYALTDAELGIPALDA